MVSYNLLVKRSAEKELRKISSPLLSKVIEKIRSLTAHPRPAGAQMLKGEDRFYRLRQGDYRIIYKVDDERQEVTVMKVGHRREVYD